MPKHSLLLIVLFAVCAPASAQTRIVAPDFLSPLSRVEFETITNAKNFEKGELSWKSVSNRARFFAHEDCVRLWDARVAFDVSIKANSPIRIHAVGFRVASNLHKQNASVWSRELGFVAAQTQINLTPLEIANLLVELRSHVGTEFDRKQTKTVVFAKLCLHHSLIRKRNENWLLIEFRDYPNDYPMFACALAHRLAARTSVLTTIKPHPQDEEFESLVDSSREEPLIANRPHAFNRIGIESLAVEDDGLNPAAREILYGFVVNDEQRLEQYQIEQVSIIIDRETKGYESRSLDSFSALFPPGKTMTYEDIHRRCAAFAKYEQPFARSTGHDGVFQFNIVPFKHGKYTYTKIYTEFVPFPEFKE